MACCYEVLSRFLIVGFQDVLLWTADPLLSFGACCYLVVSVFFPFTGFQLTISKMMSVACARTSQHSCVVKVQHRVHSPPVILSHSH